LRSEKKVKKVLTKNIQEVKILSKGEDYFYVRCVAYKNIRAISRSHPRLKATERSEVTLDWLPCGVATWAVINALTEKFIH